MNDTEYRFDTLSGQMMHQEWGNRHLYFLYDDSNQPYALLYRNGNNAPILYYYLLNIQGDVVGLMDENQQIQALYRYDPWGAVTVLSANGSVDTSSSSIGMINPLRYRGYYYDSETGFYYLETRYYDPALGRFLNADTYSTTDTEGFLSYNMFAYCENDPVNRIDKNGEFFNTIVGAIAGGIVSGVSAKISGGNIWRSIISGVVNGAIAGLAADFAACCPIVVGIAIVGASSAALSIVDDVRNKKTKTEIIGNAATAAVLSIATFGHGKAAAAVGGPKDKTLKEVWNGTKTRIKSVKSIKSIKKSKKQSESGKSKKGIHIPVPGALKKGNRCLTFFNVCCSFRSGFLQELFKRISHGFAVRKK